MRVLAHLVKASCSMSRSAVWHAWRKYPTSALSAVALFLIKTKGWVFLEGIGQTAFYADVGDFLQEYHRSDLDREREALTRCTPILAYHPLARRLFKGTPVTTKIIKQYLNIADWIFMNSWSSSILDQHSCFSTCFNSAIRYTAY